MTGLAPCGTCGTFHDLLRCNGHSRARGGQQCGAKPQNGFDTCQRHRIQASAQAAAASTTVAVRPDRIGRMAGGVVVAERVENPLLELQILAGEARGWKVAIGEMVQELLKLEKIRYATDGGEQIRGEILLWERAVDRLANLLAVIAKLNIDERLVKIQEGQRDMILAAIEAGLAAIGVTGVAASTAKLEAARHLRVVAA